MYCYVLCTFSVATICQYEEIRFTSLLIVQNIYVSSVKSRMRLVLSMWDARAWQIHSFLFMQSKRQYWHPDVCGDKDHAQSDWSEGHRALRILRIFTYPNVSVRLFGSSCNKCHFSPNSVYAVVPASPPEALRWRILTLQTQYFCIEPCVLSRRDARSCHFSL